MLWHLWEEHNYRWNICRVAKGVHTGSLEVLPLIMYVVSCHNVFVSSPDLGLKISNCKDGNDAFLQGYVHRI